MKEFKVSLVKVYHETFSIEAESGAAAIEETLKLKEKGVESESVFSHYTEPHFWLVEEEGDDAVRLARDYL